VRHLGLFVIQQHSKLIAADIISATRQEYRFRNDAAPQYLFNPSGKFL